MLELESDVQEENGYYQVKCLSQKAQDAYSMAPGIRVFEYFPARERHLRPFGTRYAILWDNYFTMDLESDDLERVLESMADDLTAARSMAEKLKEPGDLDYLAFEILRAKRTAPRLYRALERITERLEG